MNQLKEEIYDRVNNLRFQQKKGAEFIQKQLFKELEKEVPLELIYEIINEIKFGKNMIAETADLIREIREDIPSKDKERADGGLKEVVKGIGNEKLYDYSPETDHIIFYPDGKPYPVLRTTVLAMHEKYSKDGENLSGKQMQYEFQLTPKAWHYIKNVLNLYKDSVPFDVVTLSQMTSKEEMDKAAKDKAEQLTEAKMRRIYDDEERRFKEKKIKEYAKTNKGYDLLMDKLERVIKLYQPRDFDSVEIPEVNNRKVRDIFITDAHIGKMGTDGVVVRFKKLTRDLIECDEKNINITFGGDLGELFIPYGEMHPGQRLGMENITTEELIMLIVDVFEQMLLSLYKAGKKVTLNGMGGNHDRVTDKKEFDPYRTPAMVVYRFLQKIVENTNIKINILRDKLNVIQSGNIKYVFLHGDGLSAAQLNRIALEYKENGLYLVIVSGDKHSYKMQEISDSILWIQSPALAGQGKYDKELNLSSLPGAVEFIKNNDGLIDVLVRRYK